MDASPSRHSGIVGTDKLTSSSDIPGSGALVKVKPGIMSYLLMPGELQAVRIIRTTT